jgi:nucleotide-binding universal stress UspA family protein
MTGVPVPPDVLRIVVGYDGSDTARRGLARIRQLTPRRSAVLIVAVQPEVRSAGLGDKLTDQPVATERLLEDARALLGDDEAINVETRAAVGDPATVLVDAAREWGAELLVVGRRSRDFVARALLGSVSQRVVQTAPCDVLVVA